MILISINCVQLSIWSNCNEKTKGSYSSWASKTTI